MLLGENKEISSTTHQTLQKKKNNPKIWIPQLNMPSCHRERISEKKAQLLWGSRHFPPNSSCTVCTFHSPIHKYRWNS